MLRAVRVCTCFCKALLGADWERLQHAHCAGYHPPVGLSWIESLAHSELITGTNAVQLACQQQSDSRSDDSLQNANLITSLLLMHAFECQSPQFLCHGWQPTMVGLVLLVAVNA